MKEEWQFWTGLWVAGLGLIVVSGMLRGFLPGSMPLPAVMALLILVGVALIVLFRQVRRKR